MKCLVLANHSCCTYDLATPLKHLAAHDLADSDYQVLLKEKKVNEAAEKNSKKNKNSNDKEIALKKQKAIDDFETKAQLSFTDADVQELINELENFPA